MIVLPGGYKGVSRLDGHKMLTKMLTAAAGWIGAVGAAPAMILRKHRILRGKKATCSPDLAKKWSLFGNKDGTEWLDQRVVVSRGHNQNIVTAQGAGTSMEFALKLVSVLVGLEKAKKVEAELNHVGAAYLDDDREL